MARFRYRMQSILDIKEKLEDQARQELASAQAALNGETRRLEELKARKSGYEEEAAGLLSGTLILREIEDNKSGHAGKKNARKAEGARVRGFSGRRKKAGRQRGGRTDKLYLRSEKVPITGSRGSGRM